MNNGLYIQNLKVLSYPISSMFSFRKPNFINSFLTNNTKDKDKIIETIFHEIREGFYTTKLDSLKLICEMNWKRKDYVSKYSVEDFYYDINDTLAMKFLYLKDGQLYIDGISSSNNIPYEREEGDNYNHKFQWYYLKHLMNEDTLIGAFMAKNNYIRPNDLELWSTPIYTTDTLLEKCLEEGMADLHMHLGAGKRFRTVWTEVMNFFNNASIIKFIDKLQVKDDYEKVKFTPYIKVCSLVRLLLSLSIANDFKMDNIYDELNKRNVEDLPVVLNLIKAFEEGTELKDDIPQSVIENILRAFDLNYKSVSVDYTVNKLLATDILTYIFKDIYRYNEKTQSIERLYKFNSIVLPECVFITKAMYYIKNQKSKEQDKLFTKLFWQYVKIKNIFYKYVVQQYTSGKGLDIFSNVNKHHGSPLVHVNENNKPFMYLMSEVFYGQTIGQNIRKLEIRVTIDEINKLKQNLFFFFEEYRNLLENPPADLNSIPDIGIIYNFKKESDKKDTNKCIYKYHKENNAKYLNYGELSEKYYTYAKDLAKLRTEIPLLDKYIIGIDAASKENETEPYVFKKAYAVLRDNDLNRNLSINNRSFVDTIGFTFHVGEEFRHIVSGLRHIDEVIEELEFKAGDRLGHAIALGIDVNKWADINQCVYIPAGEHLENLLWEWSVYAKDQDYRDNENISLLENTILDVVEYIFGFTDGVTVRDLYKSYKRKIGECCSVKSKKAKTCKLQPLTIKKYLNETEDYNEEISLDLEKQDIDEDSLTWTPAQIYEAIHCDFFLKGMDKIVTINIDKYRIEKYKKFQTYMKKKINTRGIIIETNPTSNMIIGDFTTFDDYYITNLSSPEKEECIVTINTDDPIVFNTRVNNEFALIYDILMKKGKYSSKEVINWLDKIRRNGLKYSFIKDRDISNDTRIEEIETIIKALK